MNEPARGMTVVGPQGQLGTVEEVIYEDTGGAARVMVRRDDGQNMVLQPDSYQVDNGVLRLGTGDRLETQRVPAGDLSQGAAGDIYRTQQLGTVGTAETREVRAGEGIVVPVIQEELQVTRREIERGGVRVHKYVEEREEVVEEPTYREEVTVERVTVGRPLEEEIGSRQEGDTLIIPVLEEMLVVEKRLVLVEEIRITKRRIEETEQARVVLRQERVEVEELGDPATLDDSPVA